MKRFSDLGPRIRAHREARGWTQAALATRVGVSPIYIRKLEAGERRAPSLAVLQRISQALGAGPDLEVAFVRKRPHPRPTNGMRKRKTPVCNLCVAVDEMLSRPPTLDRAQEEADLAGAGLARQQHRAQVQDRLRTIEERYLGLGKAQ